MNFNPRTEKDMADFIARHMRDGRAWDRKFDDDSVLRKLLLSLGAGFIEIEKLVKIVVDDYDIDQSVYLLPEWEESYGLPDSCLGVETDIVKRRNAVKTRIKKETLVTLEQLQSYVDELFPEHTITLYPGYDYYGFEYDFEHEFWGNANERFVLVVEIFDFDDIFEYEFEHDFSGSVDTAQIECVLKKVIPANVVLDFVFSAVEPPAPPIYILTELGNDLVTENDKQIEIG